jgi:V8-like Glu-specific endopeptidase
MATEKPIPYRSLSRRVPVRDAIAPPPEVSLTKTLFLGGREPKASMQSLDPVVPSYQVEGQERVFRVDVALDRVAVGQRSFAPGLDGTRLPVRRKLLRERDNGDALVGFLPDHLPLRVQPEALDKLLAAPKRIDLAAMLRKPDVKWATTVFSPDDRYTFSDTGFPWCTAGRVETSLGGWASGVMIGPRHLLTCSHTIGWIANPDPYVAGWVRFAPSYFDGSEPFGDAWGIHIYWQEQVTPPTISGTEGRNDYVVVVLDRRMGDLTGWMGSRTYSDSWDGGTYWSHIGYPGDLASGTRPSFQGSFSLDGHATQPGTNQEIHHKADVWPGQSGGPVFGWWSGEPWPRVVADQSWQNSSTNGASGGSNMVDLVIRARSDFP